MSLEVTPGKITALVGLNRSGKTTCVKLLERFYQPLSGEILLDGKPLKDYKDQYLHEKVGGNQKVVLQSAKYLVNCHRWIHNNFLKLSLRNEFRDF